MRGEMRKMQLWVDKFKVMNFVLHIKLKPTSHPCSPRNLIQETEPDTATSGKNDTGPQVGQVVAARVRVTGALPPPLEAVRALGSAMSLSSGSRGTGCPSSCTTFQNKTKQNTQPLAGSPQGGPLTERKAMSSSWKRRWCH